MKHDIIIIGAGMAGLSCAYTLYKNGINSLLLEQADAVGGRVRTDQVDGFLLDRGFQVFLTAYPTAQEMLNLNALKLQHFKSGALVHVGNSFQTLSDPKRHKQDLWKTLFANVGQFSDKFRILKLRRSLMNKSVDQIFTQSDVAVLETLRQYWHFSDNMIEMFFRPFLGGVMLDHSLRSSSNMFELIMKMFAEGTATLPMEGMQAIPQQLANNMPSHNIRLNTSVAQVETNAVTLASGERLEADYIVIATDALNAHQFVPFTQQPKFRTVTTLYFSADDAPISEPLLALESEPKGALNHIAVLSNIAPSYAPQGKHLISATILDHRPELKAESLLAAKKHLKIWFGDVVNKWTHLRTYHIPQALPDQRNLPFTKQGFKQIRPNVFMCGDYLNFGAIEGALCSGKKVAEQIILQNRQTDS